MRIYAAFAVYKPETQTLERTVSVAFLNQNWKQEKLLSAYIAVAVDAQVDVSSVFSANLCRTIFIARAIYMPAVSYKTVITGLANIKTPF